MKPLKKYEDYLHQKLQKPDYAKTYLAVALEEYEKDQDLEAFLLAIKDVAQAQGGLSQLAMRSNLNRQNLYKALSKHGNPKLTTIGAILRGLGFRLSVEALNHS